MAHKHEHDSVSGIGIAFFLNLFFAIFEIVGSVFTNSLALLSNGLHDLGDVLSLGLTLILNIFARKNGDKKFTYGYRRLSLVAAFLNSLILIGGALFILSEAIPRLMNPEHSDASGMIVFAAVGLVINIIGYTQLRKGKTMSEKVAALHLLDDVLGLSSILIIGIVIQFYDLHILDPLLSIVITCYVLWNVIKDFRKTINLFLQATPDDMDLSKIEADIREVPGVVGFHDMHVWSLDGSHNIMSAHVVVKGNASHDKMLDIKCKAKAIISKAGIQHSTVEIECEDEKCYVEN